MPPRDRSSPAIRKDCPIGPTINRFVGDSAVWASSLGRQKAERRKKIIPLINPATRTATSGRPMEMPTNVAITIFARAIGQNARFQHVYLGGPRHERAASVAR
jgi:hypothetical protein